MDALGRAIQADPEQRIDDDIGAGERMRVVDVDIASGRVPLRPRPGGRFTCRPRTDPEDCDLHSRRMCERRDHVAITAIVAAATDHREVSRPRPTRAQAGQCRRTGTLHQRPVVMTGQGHRLRLDAAHVMHSEQLGREIGHVGIVRGLAYTAVMSETPFDPQQLADRIKQEAMALGFQSCAIAGTRLDQDEAHLQRWLDDGFHGDMDYMQRHGAKRTRPAELVAGTISVVSVRLDYLRADAADMQSTLDDPNLAYVSRYALGRDYHKLMRQRLQQLADRIVELAGPFGYRAFVDSAPVLERALARNAGLGWIGKNTLLIHPRYGSWFFIGELYTDLPLPHDRPETGHYCGTCTRCIDICPTAAIVAPNRIDARRCISYLTIELKGVMPRELRPQIGNWIFGCDVCQTVCPWNGRHRQADLSKATDIFAPRLDDLAPPLLDLIELDAAALRARFRRTPLLRNGHSGLLRNVCVALGNWANPAAVPALSRRLADPEPLLRGHAAWALGRIFDAAARHALDQAWRRETDPDARLEISLALDQAP